ncbi:MAG: HU family DNA-binding protein [Pseudomonadota bacterium]
MNKAKMVGIVRKHGGCTIAKAKAAVDALFENIAKTLKKESRLSVVGFGTFKVTKRGARKGRNPRTGEAIRIGPSKSVRFKASKTLRATL